VRQLYDNDVFDHLDRPQEDVDQVNELCDKVDDININFPPKGDPDPQKIRTIVRNFSGTLRTKLNLEGHQIKWIRTTLERKPKGKFEICEDPIPLAVAAQNLWQFFNLTHIYTPVTMNM